MRFCSVGWSISRLPQWGPPGCGGYPPDRDLMRRLHRLEVLEENHWSSIFRCVRCSIGPSVRITFRFPLVSLDRNHRNRASVDHGTWYISWKPWPTAFRLRLPTSIFPKCIFVKEEKVLWFWQYLGNKKSHRRSTGGKLQDFLRAIPDIGAL